MRTFELPDLGEGLPDAEIVRWLVKEGDMVALDQPMVEMETAKAVVEVPSPYKGVISKLCGEEGEVINVGAVLVEFDGEQGVSQSQPQQSDTNTENDSVMKTENSTAEAISSAGSESMQIFKLPDLGEGLPDAEIVRWLVKEGDDLTLDQPMVEMETAKAVVEVPSPFTAKVAKLHGQAGDVIEVGAVLVSFGSGTVQPASSNVSEAKEAAADAATVVGAVQVGNQVVSESANAVIKALAKKLKVDLSQVTGTGKNGVISQADVKQAKKEGKLIGA
ncbi:MAG: biotin/lipoyl-containing protein, partial [Kangiellaceae bacterium]